MTVLDHRTTGPRRRARTVLLSTISSDAHTWNLVLLQLALEEAGYAVVNLGPCVPDELLVSSVRHHAPDAVVISTLNGHGVVEGARAVHRLRADPAGADVPILIGGKLGIHGPGDVKYSGELVRAGADAVFADSSAPEDLLGYLGELPAGAPAVTA